MEYCIKYTHKQCGWHTIESNLYFADRVSSMIYWRDTKIRTSESGCGVYCQFVSARTKYKLYIDFSKYLKFEIIEITIWQLLSDKISAHI